MKILTVPSSNTGRSIGDVFLALFSSVHLAKKSAPIAFLTHSNHSEVASFFRKSLDMILLSESADKHAQHLETVNIHWSHSPWEQRLPDIHNPWRYFVMNGVAPYQVSFELPRAAERANEKCVLIFPERSDNVRLNDSLFSNFIAKAQAQGFEIYTNCYLNSNYVTSPPIHGTKALTQLSLGEIIAIASNPNNILVGTRSGLFDVLYFVLPKVAARLLIFYPPEPGWLWDAARFQNEAAKMKFPQYYFDRPGVTEIKTEDFSDDILARVLTA